MFGMLSGLFSYVLVLGFNSVSETPLAPNGLMPDDVSAVNRRSGYRR